MRKTRLFSDSPVLAVIVTFFLLLTAAACSTAPVSVIAGKSDSTSRLHVSETYGRLPLHFESNHGQTDEQVKFFARSKGLTLFLTPTEAVLVLTKRAPATRTALRMTFVGANPEPRLVGTEELPGKANYFIGRDPTKWRTNVPTYAKVRYENVYPGIDLIYYGNQRQLEYDFVVAPGADPQRILLAFEDADKLEVDDQGDLILHTSAGALRHRKPFIYQEVDGVRREIAGGYVLTGEHRVGFKVAAYDANQPLLIDPALFYSTYLGGSSSDSGEAIAVDAAGNAYVTGTASSPDFPTTPGAFQTSLPGFAFITKLNPTGSGLVYSTHLGGSTAERGVAIAVDGAGNAYVTGNTNSPDFPTTPGAFQSTFGGGIEDAFVTKLNPTGSGLVYSTLVGLTMKPASASRWTPRATPP